MSCLRVLGSGSLGAEIVGMWMRETFFGWGNRFEPRSLRIRNQKARFGLSESPNALTSIGNWQLALDKLEGAKDET